MTQIKSYIDRIIDFGIVEDEFKNDAGENIKYKQTVVRVEVGGEVEDIVLSGTNAIKPKFLALTLKSAKVIRKDTGILDD